LSTRKYIVSYRIVGISLNPSIITDRVSWEGKAIGSVRLSIRLSVCLSIHPLVSTLFLNRLTFKLEFWSVDHDHSSPRIESEGQRSRSNVNVQCVWAWQRSNADGL